MLLAQITDLHMRDDETPLSGRLVTRPFSARAIDALAAIVPDAVVVTGDLTDIGTPCEYALLRRELDRLAMPVHVIPGNHDRHDAFRDAFEDHAYLPAEGPMNWVIEGPLRIVGLDSVVPGHGHGLLARETLAWLDATLATDPRPAIVALHHPPFPTGIAAMDRIGCLNGAEMAEVIARHPQVERVIAGHHHRAVQVRWAGTIGQICPAVAHQVALSFEDRPMPEWTLEPPAMLLHRFAPETGVITHHAYIDVFDGPHPFALDPDYPGKGSI